PTLATFWEQIGELTGAPPELRPFTEDTVRAASEGLPPGFARYLWAITHDTAVPTGLRAGEKINVIPSEAVAWVDGGFLPGHSVEGFLNEVRAVIGDGYEIEPSDVTPPLE